MGKLVSLLMLVSVQAASAGQVYHCKGNTDLGPATARISTVGSKGWETSLVVQYTNGFFTQTTRGEYTAYYNSATREQVATGVIADIDSRMILTFQPDGPVLMTLFAGGDKGDRRIEFGSGAHLVCE